MSIEIIHYPQDRNTLYGPAQAAHIACVTLDFLAAAEREGLLRRKTTPRGTTGFTMDDIQRLVIIRRLHEDLLLDFPAIDIVLHLREKVEEHVRRRRKLEGEVEDMERRMERFRRLIARYQSRR